MEGLLSDVDRVRAIYELAINQPTMDMPELLWKSWIDFEYEEEEFDRTRDLYERLLCRTSHVKVWVSFAQFEANAGLARAQALAGGDDDDEEEEDAAPKPVVEVDQAAVDEAKADGLERARKVFERGYKDLKQKLLKEEVSSRFSTPPPCSPFTDILFNLPASRSSRSLESARNLSRRLRILGQGGGDASSSRQEDAQGRRRCFHDGGVYVFLSDFSSFFPY